MASVPAAWPDGGRGLIVRFVDWAERFARIRRWSRGSERAPHKPLLLLYALGRFQRHGDAPILSSGAAEQLGRLPLECGAPRPTSPACPSHHRTSGGLWRGSTAGGGGSPGAS